MPVYTPKTWQDDPSTVTPLDAAGLNDWETRIDGAFDQHEADAALHSSGRELAYAERTSDYAWSGTTLTDLHAAGTSGAALSITFTAGARPIEVVGFAPYSYLSAGSGTPGVTLYITDSANVVVAIAPAAAMTIGEVRGMLARRRLSLINGQSYTYKLRFQGGGTSPAGTFFAAGAGDVISLQAIER